MKCFKILFMLIIPLAVNNISSQTSFFNAVDFDGNGDYANTFNNPFLPTNNGTIEAWVKVRSILPPGGNEGEVFVSKNEEQWNLGDFYVFFDYSTGKLKSRIQTSPSVEIDVQSNNSFGSSLEVWFHYAFTWGSNGMKMYINGLLQNNQNNLTYSALNNTYNIYVGAHGYMLHNGTYVVSDFFDGQIDELRIWNYQRNNQQILALKDSPLDSSYYVTIDSGLVGYWKFDELEDLGINNDGVDDVRDLSVLHNHLDLAGDAHLAGSNILPGEPITFEKTFGGVGQERGIGIDWTSDSGYIIVGSTASFTSNEITYVVKLDSTGSLEWSKAYDAYGFSKLSGVKQSSDGNYFLSGFVEGGFGFYDHVIMKVDISGDIIWVKNFGGVEAEELRKLSITSGGGLLVAGYNASVGAGAKDVQAIKFSSNGTVEWAKTYGTYYEDFNSSNEVASDGSYVLSGAVDISGFYDIRPTLIKTDTLGNILWAKYYSGYYEDWGRDVTETPDGGYLLTGDTRSYGYGGSQDICLIKTDISGNVEWAKAYGGISDETGYSVILTSDEKYVIAGYTNSFGFGGYDAFLMKIDLNGFIEWFHTYGGYTSDYVYDLIETPDYGFALTGRRSSNTLGGDDLYLIKTDIDGSSSCDYGSFVPNVFIISNIQSVNLNMSTSSVISVSDLSLTVITPNSAQNNSCAIVPVELKSFNYELDHNNVILNWSTVTETNNMGFKILKDGVEIGYVTGSGTTTEPRNYSFKDEKVKFGTYCYQLIQIDYDGTIKKIGELEINVGNIPQDFDLEQNYPNPFNPITTIRYAVPFSNQVSIKIYDITGQLVSVLVNEVKEPGTYEVSFNTEGLSSGIYVYQMIAGDYFSVKKMNLLK